jgi:hypothetical protein
MGCRVRDAHLNPIPEARNLDGEESTAVFERCRLAGFVGFRQNVVERRFPNDRQDVRRRK